MNSKLLRLLANAKEAIEKIQELYSSGEASGSDVIEALRKIASMATDAIQDI